MSWAVLPMTSTASSGSVTPGSSTITRRSPERCRDGSDTPSWSTRRRRTSRVRSTVSPSTFTVSVSSASRTIWVPPRRSRPRRAGRVAMRTAAPTTAARTTAARQRGCCTIGTPPAPAGPFGGARRYDDGDVRRSGGRGVPGGRWRGGGPGGADARRRAAGRRRTGRRAGPPGRRAPRPAAGASGRGRDGSGRRRTGRAGGAGLGPGRDDRHVDPGGSRDQAAGGRLVAGGAGVGVEGPPKPPARPMAAATTTIASHSRCGPRLAIAPSYGPTRRPVTDMGRRRTMMG